MIQSDEVIDRITSQVRIYGKQQKNGRITMNCPMCVFRGETPDRRGRLGVFVGPESIGTNCFNCRFTSRYVSGQQVSRNTQDFMREIGIPIDEVNRLSYAAWQKSIDAKPQDEIKRIFSKPTFKKIPLPPHAKTIAEWAVLNCDSEKFIDAATYVLNRQHSASPESIYWDAAQPNYILIPCYAKSQIVGWTSRAIYDGLPKYLNEHMPENYLFNCDVMSKKNRKYMIIVEGIFDALAIDAVGTIGASLSETQIAWLNDMTIPKILVPDRDKAGKKLINVAKENNWHVSLPSVKDSKSIRRWHPTIKDVDDAVKNYGKLWTLHSILQHKTKDPLIINNIERTF